MMTSSNGNISSVTGPLWGESNGHLWIPLAKAVDAERWFFCAWTNRWANHPDADDLRRHRAHYDVTVMHSWWRHQMETFSALLAICAGNSPVTVTSPHKGQWRGALMLSLICAWINDWVNNRQAGDFRRHHAHYDVTVMYCVMVWLFWCNSLKHNQSLLRCNLAYYCFMWALVSPLLAYLN